MLYPLGWAYQFYPGFSQPLTVLSYQNLWILQMCNVWDSSMQMQTNAQINIIDYQKVLVLAWVKTCTHYQNGIHTMLGFFNAACLKLWNKYPDCICVLPLCMNHSINNICALTVVGFSLLNLKLVEIRCIKFKMYVLVWSIEF